MSNLIYLVAPLTLLMGAVLAFYLWRTFETPRRDGDGEAKAPEDEATE